MGNFIYFSMTIQNFKEKYNYMKKFFIKKFLFIFSGIIGVKYGYQNQTFQTLQYTNDINTKPIIWPISLI